LGCAGNFVVRVREPLLFGARVGGFLARHSLALMITVGSACGVWTVAYFALLLWAVFAGGLGSPLVYPLGLLAVVVAGTALCCGLFLPASGLAEWFARRRGLPVLAQIPLSLVVLWTLSTGVVAAGAAIGLFPTVRSAGILLGIFLLFQLVPFGIYWWIAEGGAVLTSVVLRRSAGVR
jgi:hypothetical protein